MQAQLTAKQRTCKHTRVAPTMDERWERCLLCGLVRQAPVLAPWIAAYDATRPPEAPPDLFAGLALIGETEEREESTQRREHIHAAAVLA